MAFQFNISQIPLFQKGERRTPAKVVREMHLKGFVLETIARVTHLTLDDVQAGLREI